jgi:hypothetical protein
MLIDNLFKKKKSILLLISLFCLSLLNAQTVSQNHPEGRPSEDFFSQAEFVFEGQYIKIVETYDIQGRDDPPDYSDDVHTIRAYKVFRVYKGDQSLTDSIIYVVNGNGILGGEYISMETAHSHPRIPQIFSDNGIRYGVDPYTPAIFFLVKSDLPENKAVTKYSSYKKYKSLQEDKRSYDILYVCKEINTIVGLNNLVFRNRNDFYDYMRQFDGYTVPEAIPIIPVIDHSLNQHVRQPINQNELPDCAKNFGSASKER